MDGSSSLRDNDPSAARASSAASAKTDELSAPLVFGLFSPRSNFPDPAVAIAELAVRLGMNRSP